VNTILHLSGQFAHSKHQLLTHFLALKTCRDISRYPGILLGIWNNLCFTRLGFRPTPNIQQCWSTGRLLLLPLFSLYQHDGRTRKCQYMIYRRHSFVDHDTFKLRRHNPTLYATVHKRSLHTVTLNKTTTNGEAWQWHWRLRKVNRRIKQRPIQLALQTSVHRP
jgi:hypothetical protein